MRQLRYYINRYYKIQDQEELYDSMDCIEIMTHIINSQSKKYEKKVIVIIDEYDTPLVNCTDPQLFAYYQQLYRTISTNPNLKGLLLFGIHQMPLDIPIKIYGQLADQSLLPYFSYTKEEILQLFAYEKEFRKQYESKQTLEYAEECYLPELKEHCLLYTINGIDYYNKFDISCSINDKKLSLKWVKDVSYKEFIKDINRFSKENQNTICTITNDLINNKVCSVLLNIPTDFIPSIFPTETIYQPLYYWTMLIYTGYLRAIPTETKYKYNLSISNKSLHNFFIKLLDGIQG